MNTYNYGLIETSPTSGSRPLLRFLDELSRGERSNRRDGGRAIVPDGGELVRALVVTKRILPEARELARVAFRDAQVPGVPALSADMLNKIAQNSPKFSTIARYDPQAIYAFVMAAAGLGADGSVAQAAAATEAANLAWNAKLCKAYGVAMAPSCPPLYGDPVFGTASKLPLVPELQVNGTDLEIANDAKLAGMAVKVAGLASNFLGLGLSAILGPVGIVASLVSTVFGMFGGPPSISPQLWFWKYITDDTLHTVNRQKCIETVTQLIEATESKVSGDMSYLMAQLLGMYVPQGALITPPTVPDPVIYNNQNPPPGSFTSSEAPYFSKFSGVDWPQWTTFTPPVTQRDRFSGVRYAWNISPPPGLSTGSTDYTVPGSSVVRTDLGSSGLLPQYGSDLYQSFFNLASAQDDSNQYVGTAIGLVRCLQQLSGLDFTPALKILLSRSPQYQAWLRNVQSTAGHAANRVADADPFPLGQLLPLHGGELVDMTRDVSARLNRVAGDYGEHMLVKGTPPPRAEAHYHTVKRLRDEGDCPGDGPTFWAHDALAQGTVYKSSMVEVGVAPLEHGVFGVTEVSDLPMKITVNSDAVGSRAQIALAHELGHVMDLTYKLNLSHEQVHQVGVFAATEMLPAMEAFKTKQDLK